jgi:hypothetical protein
MKEKENITYSLDMDMEDEEIDIHEILQQFEKQTSNEDVIMAEMKHYDLNCTNKQLLLICEYYGLIKKARTMKKQDMITMILLFEYEEQNMEIVLKRKHLWSCMDELKNEKFMKRFIIW